VRTSLQRIVVAVALFAGVLVPATAGHASPPPWYWYQSPVGSTGGCIQTTASPSQGASNEPCDNIGSGYLGSQNHLPNGAFGDMNAGSSGDFCNSYESAPYGDPFYGYVDNNPYYYGDTHPAPDPFTGSYCYADKTVWGSNDNQTTSSLLYPGVQHFASLQGIVAKPWSFGTNPSLYMYGEFGVMTNTAVQAWGYLCADLEDTTAGYNGTLEICDDVWDWGGKNPLFSFAGCSTGSAYHARPLGTVENWVQSTRYSTERSGSKPTQTTATIKTPLPFSVQITTQNLLNAIADAKAGCSAQSGGFALQLSNNTQNYRLMGVEQGLELGKDKQTPPTTKGNVNGVEQALLFATLYN
jgi:hypothetical protein